MDNDVLLTHVLQHPLSISFKALVQARFVIVVVM